jgi:hypothetical protein
MITAIRSTSRRAARRRSRSGLEDHKYRSPGSQQPPDLRGADDAGEAGTALCDGAAARGQNRDWVLDFELRLPAVRKLVRKPLDQHVLQ